MQMFFFLLTGTYFIGAAQNAHSSYHHRQSEYSSSQKVTATYARKQCIESLPHNDSAFERYLSTCQQQSDFDFERIQYRCTVHLCYSLSSIPVFQLNSRFSLPFKKRINVILYHLCVANLFEFISPFVMCYKNVNARPEQKNQSDIFNKLETVAE